MNDLKQVAIRGGVAKIVAQGANFALRMGSLMILARLLSPVDFGLVGMVTAVTGVLSLFREFGLSTASVQRAEINEGQISTLFWINLVVGGVLGALALAIAPLVAAFYHEPRLFSVTIVLAAGFVFNGAGVQHSAQLQRQLRFTTIAGIEIASLLTSSVISIAMALRGYGYWALVAWSVTLPVASTIFMWLKTGWFPGRPRLGTGMRSMMGFGTIVTLNYLVVHVAYNLDKVLLGRFFGAEITGIYGRAYQLVTLPTDNLNSAVGSVAFPVMSRIQDQPGRLRSYFLKAYSLVLAVTIPITLVAGLFARDLVAVVFGPQWGDTVPVFRLLVPTILIFALINPTGWLLVSLGMVGRSLKIAFAIAPLVIAGYVIGLPWGPQGVALGFSGAMTLWLVPHLIWCFHGTPISYRDVWHVVSRPLLSGLVGVVAAYVATLPLAASFPALGRLFLGSTVLFLVYGWMLLFVMAQKPLYLDLLRNLKGQGSREAMASV